MPSHGLRAMIRSRTAARKMPTRHHARRRLSLGSSRSVSRLTHTCTSLGLIDDIARRRARGTHCDATAARCSSGYSGDALGRAPLLGVLPERDAARSRVDVLVGHDCRGHLVKPALRIRLPAEVLGMLAAILIAVSCAPLAVRPLSYAFCAISRRPSPDPRTAPEVLPDEPS